MSTERLISRLAVHLAAVICAFASLSSKAMGENEQVPVAWTAYYPDCQARVYISRVCVRPPYGTDWPVWIEIWNHSVQTVDLKGYSLETLQTRIEPFGNGLRLATNEVCVVLVYPGDKQSTNFEARLPAGLKIVRCMNKPMFPSCFTANEWRARLKKGSDKGNIFRDKSVEELSDYELDREVSLYCGSTRYHNEVALRSNANELIAFLRWGRLECFGIAQSKATQDAVTKGLFDNAPFRVPGPIELSDTGCAVLTIMRHGIYLPVWNAEMMCMPGVPMLREPAVPILKSPINCKLNDENGYILIVIGFAQTNTVGSEIERAWGWSLPFPEIYYDREMIKPVFNHVRRLDHNWREEISFNLRPEEFFCVVDRPLYCRFKKICYKTPPEPPVYSKSCEIRLNLAESVFREFKLKKTVAESSQTIVDGSYSRIYSNAENVATDKIWDYINSCNTFLAKHPYARMRYNMQNAGREVVVTFDGKKDTDDISLLAGLPIKKLDLSDSHVANIDALKGMPLRTLDLRNTPVKDLAALHGLPLESLDISGTEIADVSPLVGCPLKHLTLDHTKVKNLDALIGNGNETTQVTNGVNVVIDFKRGVRK